MTGVRRVDAGTPVVVVGVDDAEPRASVDLQVAAAEARRRGASIRLVHGCATASAAGTIGAYVTDERLHYGQYLLTRAVAVLRGLGAGEADVTTVNSRELGADALLAHSAGAALVVLRRTRSSSRGSVSGSTTGVVAAQARCPVLVLPAGASGGDRVVVAAEDVTSSAALVGLAAAEALRRGIPLTVVHPWQRPPEERDGQRGRGRAVTSAVAEDIAREELAVAILGVATDFPTLVVGSRLARGPAVDVLVAASEGAAVLVVGRSELPSTGAGLRGAWEELVARVRCPLLVRWASPVTALPDSGHGPSFLRPVELAPG